MPRSSSEQWHQWPAAGVRGEIPRAKHNLCEGLGRVAFRYNDRMIEIARPTDLIRSVCFPTVLFQCTLLMVLIVAKSSSRPSAAVLLSVVRMRAQG